MTRRRTRSRRRRQSLRLSRPSARRQQLVDPGHRDGQVEASEHALERPRRGWSAPMAGCRLSRRCPSARIARPIAGRQEKSRRPSRQPPARPTGFADLRISTRAPRGRIVEGPISTANPKAAEHFSEGSKKNPPCYRGVRWSGKRDLNRVCGERQVGDCTLLSQH